MRTLIPLLLLCSIGLAADVYAACGDGCCSYDERPIYTDPTTCPADCTDYPSNICGDGCLGLGEACDWGELSSDSAPDACRTNCRFAYCGDGVVDNGEICDDNNNNDGDGCDHDCTLTGCGNGIRTIDEECDDGNLVDGDGCDSNCKATACGNGVTTPGTGESCDDGNTEDGDACLSSCIDADHCCVPNVCGDGVVNMSLVDEVPVELCDDGHDFEGTGSDGDCRYDCRQVLGDCGNQFLDPGEICDFGILNSWEPDAFCRPDCLAPRCGDGVRDSDEACDQEPGCGPDCRWLQ